MKRFTGWVGVIWLILFLAQCQQEGDKKLVGIWQLEKMNINGTEIDGHSLGNWLWEFNEEGGYLSNVAGQTEKGWYKLKDKQLRLQITSKENRTEQIYLVGKLDTASLELSSKDEKNKATFRFIKWKQPAGEEED